MVAVALRQTDHPLGGAEMIKDPVRKELVDEYSNELHVDQTTPPTFMVQANDDSVSSLNSALFYTALRKAGVDAEYHVFRKGGHGYGFGVDRGAVSHWPSLCEEWLIATGKVKK